MTELRPRPVPRTASTEYEYGMPQTNRITYEMRIPYSTVEGTTAVALDRALTLAAGHRAFRDYPRVTASLRADLPAEQTYVIEIVAERYNAALREDNLYWSTRTRGALTTEQSSEIYEFPEAAGPGTPTITASVQHEGDTQVAQFNKFVPVVEMEAYGIFRLTQTQAAPLYDTFLGTVNRVSFRGFGPRVVMCSGLDVQPFDVGSRERSDRHRLTFRFQIRPDGWGPWVYYTDPGTGLPPPGLIPGVGYGKLEPPLLGAPYRYIDFQEFWPFSGEVL